VTLHLHFCSRAAARYAVEHWHYSKSLPPDPRVQIGVWEADRFIGCVLFSRGAAPNMLRPYGLAMTEGCELTRVALGKHSAPVSRIVSIAVGLLRKQSPGLRLVVSYADPVHGHHGGIYQAMGWRYLGLTAGDSLFRGPDGKLWHRRMVSPTGIKRVYGKARRVLRFDQCERIDTPGKHRYALALDRALLPKLESLSRPYPKRPERGGSETVDTLGLHPREGGWTPTPPLHPSTDATPSRPSTPGGAARTNRVG